ncbi:hypothetical protein GGF32_008002 [Allomyces javanicus]|nr:hypothetical protein GGF32_008002 [Allomyces javanicus]
MTSVNSRVLQPSAPVATNAVGAPPMISASGLATKGPLDWASDDSLATLIPGTALPALPVAPETSAPCTYVGPMTEIEDGRAHAVVTSTETWSMPLPASDMLDPAIMSIVEDSVPSLDSSVAQPHATLPEMDKVTSPNMCATSATGTTADLILPQAMDQSNTALLVSHAAPTVVAAAHAIIGAIQTELAAELAAPPPSAPVIDTALAASLIPQRKDTVPRKLKTTSMLTPKKLKKREQNRINQQRARERKRWQLANLKATVAGLRLEMKQADINLARLELLKSLVKMVKGQLVALVALLFAP